MKSSSNRAVAIVGVGAILPDAPDAPAFWENIKNGVYSISEVKPDRWDPDSYYDPDPAAPDKSYCKIGGWVRQFEWNPVKWKLPIPPRVSDYMDRTQKWALVAAREALSDYGYPGRPLDSDRTAVILGNAMAGEFHYLSSLRIFFPEFADELNQAASFATLPKELRQTITEEFHGRIMGRFPDITEDTMPGELANIIAGRVANVFNFHGPNYVADAACASAMAAMSAAVKGLDEHEYDAVITGGIDSNMGPTTFTKFCKIGALSASGTRPYADGADGFVMGEGAAIFLLKRLEDAENNGDSIYAVLRGFGGSSDGKGKGITAPNPIGQRLAVKRAWENSGVVPSRATLVEGHGTSTKVGDVVEVEGLTESFKEFGLPTGSLPLGSVKSNIGHLKGAAGAAGMLKAAFALRDKLLPPSLNFERPNPNIDFAHSPLRVNTELRAWDLPNGEVRSAGVSAFGFGGTNFHAVLEEHVPGRLASLGKTQVAVGDAIDTAETSPMRAAKTPLRGALVLGADSVSDLRRRLLEVKSQADLGHAPAPAAPLAADLAGSFRLAIDYKNATELADKSAKALRALEADSPPVWKALRAQGIFRGQGPAPKVAFLFTGQGSQYLNMMAELRQCEPIVGGCFEEADRVMAPLLGGRTLTSFVFVDEAGPQAEEALRQTAITQPAVLTVDQSLTLLLKAYGIEPDMVMGHSLGEYGALVAAGAIPFGDALEAVSARGREMTRVSPGDNGWMAAVFAALEDIERIVATIDGYVVVANINSTNQAVIGGASDAVARAIEAFQKEGYDARRIPVSHAFHTSIVSPASEPLRRVLERLRLQPPRVPIVANVSGEFYPAGGDVVPEMLDILARQVASPVQFVKGLRTLYAAGARVFVEVGPKKALCGFVEDVLGATGDVSAFFTNHPKMGELASFNQALCGLYAAGLGTARDTGAQPQKPLESAAARPVTPLAAPVAASEAKPRTDFSWGPLQVVGSDNRYLELGKLFADFLEKGAKIHSGGAIRENAPDVVISGAAMGLPGTEQVFDDSNFEKMLRGDQFIDAIPTRFRRSMVDKNITRLVKTGDGGPRFEVIDNPGEVIKLAGRAGSLDLVEQFGFPAERMPALDIVTQMAIAVGIDALRDAGIPLAMRYKTTTRNTLLPDRWRLPKEMEDDTGVIFASAFPGMDSFAEDAERYHLDRARRQRMADLESLAARLSPTDRGNGLAVELQRRIADLKAEIEREPYALDRRFLFRALAMGHAQFAEYIGARGPNTHVNAACASTTQAVSIAEDWIRAGRCRRVVIISADDVTSERLLGWIGAGFLATGAAATDEVIEEAALPFDRRRHGLILGMGAAALVVESGESIAERGIRPICQVLGTITANSAYHGTRLDLDHIRGVMDQLVAEAERRWGIERSRMAPETLFVSHETYTPARGGSAQAEIDALRHVFGDSASRIVVANTKGYTGHAMGAGIEDALAVKALETGQVPPVPNFKEVDPDLGALNLSQGGSYPIRYALRLGAGFGSQISMTLFRWVPSSDGSRPSARGLGYQYRVVDPGVWRSFLDRVGGEAGCEVEVHRRTLRVKDQKSQTLGAQPSPRPEGSLKESTRPASATAMPTPIPAQSPVAIAAAPPAHPATMDDPVMDRVLGLVAKVTGYPADMLEADLDLEADLGIDTVKQAEMFAEIREAYQIPRDDSLRLREFPTLKHVLKFVRDRRPDLAPRSVSPSPHTASPPAPAEMPRQDDSVRSQVLSIVAGVTGYPADMLELDLDLEADLGIDTVKQAETFASIRSAFEIPRQENLQLREFPTLKHVLQFVHQHRPDLRTPAAAQPAPSTVEDSAPAIPGQPTVSDEVSGKVLEIVSQVTGYPADMLDPGLDLEADLGIDTVKQAETFASIRQAFAIERDENLQLREFPTINHVVEFVLGKRPDLAASRPPTSVPAPAPEKVAAIRVAAGDLEASAAIAHRVAVASVRPALNFFSPTGVVLDDKSRVLVMLDEGGVGKPLVARLEKLGVAVLAVEGAPQASDLVKRVEEWQAGGPIQGVYWLSALDPEPAIFDMPDLEAWREALRVRVKLLYATMRALYNQFDRPGSFLVAATRLGGRHGYDEGGALAPLGGSVTGFTKAFKRERASSLVKVVDFEPSRKTAALADLLVDETVGDPGVVEIGYRDGLRWTVTLAEQPVADGQTGLNLDSKTVFLVTGAAGSIVSAITGDLAQASSGVFHLFDLAPEPDPSNRDLGRLASDRDGLKRDLFERLKARGERATPAMVEKELAALERSQAASLAIQTIQRAGGVVRYHSLDLTNPEAVSNAMERVRMESGRIDVLIHAAGLEISRMLPDKKPAEYDLVFDVKSDGWFNLLHSIKDMPVGAAVVFSSIAGRFGNGGQTDYSAANDLLCKATSSFRTTRPEMRGIAIDWTAWAGIGMAARGSIPKMMEVAGIDMLAPEAGIPMVRRILTLGGWKGEVVVAERLGILLEEFAPAGGLDQAAVLEAARGPMANGAISIGPYSGLTVEVELDPAKQPFLNDHRIDGTPVLPGVMGIEGFAEAARVLFPDWNLAAVEDIDFLMPFKFYRDLPRKVTVNAHFSKQGDDLVARCRLTGERLLAGLEAPQVSTHFTARVRLTRSPAASESGSPPGGATERLVENGAIYQVYFHGPAYQVLQRVWRENGRIVGQMPEVLPGDHSPEGLPTLMAPRLIELCFQTAGIWEMGTKGRMGLPAHVDKVRTLRSPAARKGKLFAVVTPEPEGAYRAEVVDEAGDVFLRLEGYKTTQLPGNLEDGKLEPLRFAMS